MRRQLDCLDPRSPADVGAIRALLHQRRQAFHPELQAFARRVHEESADGLLRLDALNVLASAAVVSGDDDEGSLRFRSALDGAWGTGTHAERVACVNLAMILTRQRRLVEAFALSRRACRIALRDDERLAICLAHVQLGKTLLELGDPEGFEEAVEVAERHRPEIDENLRSWVPHLLAGLRAELALLQGDRATAERFMEAALDGPDVPREVAEMMRATHLRRVGRCDEALEVVRAALAAGPLEASYRLRFQAEELLCFLDLGDHAAVRERAAACMSAMVSGGPRCGTAAWRMRVGEAVGRALVQDDATRAEARVALEIAAVAALERSWEAKLFFQQFPQLERMEPEDVAVLEAHAERFRAKHLELLGAIRTLLSEGTFSEAALAEGGDDLFVSVCAWCNRIRGPERVWIPLDDFVVGTTGLEVSHGICQSCTALLVAAEASAAGAREGVVGGLSAGRRAAPCPTPAGSSCRRS